MNLIEIKAKTENLVEIIAFVNKFLEANDCPMKKKMEIELAVEETFVNIAHYAYKQGDGMMTLSIDRLEDPSGVEITFKDHGIPYNPLEKKDPTLSLPVEQKPIGGLGIFMVKKLMDGMSYKHEDGQNVLTLQKFF